MSDDEFDFDTEGLDSFITSERLETEGLWLTNFPEGRAFKVRRAGGRNREYTKALMSALKPYRRQRMDLDQMDPELSASLLRRVYCRTVIVDWREIRTKDGREVPFSPKAAMAFFKRFPEIFQDIVTLATEASMFSEKRVKEAAEALGED